MFDTNVFIRYLNGDSGAEQIVDAVVAGAASGSISVITTLEMWQFPGFDRRRELIYTGLCQIFEEVPINHKIAILAGEDMWSLRPNQRRRLMRDALIAESAKIRGEPVYTLDHRDFTRLGATVLSY